MRAELQAERAELPAPRTEEGMTLEQAMLARRSHRSFAPVPLELWQIGQLLWAAQGLVKPGRRRRTAPSAGACYALELYLACAEGWFHYLPEGHALERLATGDRRPALAAAAHGQAFVAEADVVLLLAGDYSRTTSRYGDRGVRYVHMDIGHAAQNVLLEAAALGLGAVPVGAFVDAELTRVAELPPGQDALYMVPVGHPAEQRQP